MYNTQNSYPSSDSTNAEVIEVLSLDSNDTKPSLPFVNPEASITIVQRAQIVLTAISIYELDDSKISDYQLTEWIRENTSNNRMIIGGVRVLSKLSSNSNALAKYDERLAICDVEIAKIEAEMLPIETEIQAMQAEIDARQDRVSGLRDESKEYTDKQIGSLLIECHNLCCDEIELLNQGAMASRAGRQINGLNQSKPNPKIDTLKHLLLKIRSALDTPGSRTDKELRSLLADAFGQIAITQDTITQTEINAQLAILAPFNNRKTNQIAQRNRINKPSSATLQSDAIEYRETLEKVKQSALEIISLKENTL